MNFVELKELETARLHLRQLRFDDLYDYYERIASDGEVVKYLPVQPHQDIGESLAQLEQTLAQYGEGGCYRWAVALKADDDLIGVAELTDFDEEAESCAVQCMLAEKWWNQGYGTEVLTELLRFGMEELGLKRITGEHLAPNAAAGAAMVKAGMTATGVAPGRREKHGLFHDVHTYELCAARPEALTANDYQRMAMTTLNPSLSKGDVLLNGVMGLCGESGEVIDLVKKHLHQGHELDREKLCKELGDVAWYLAETAWALDIPLEEVLRGNLEKLKKRYPGGFDTARSVNR